MRRVFYPAAWMLGPLIAVSLMAFSAQAELPRPQPTASSFAQDIELAVKARRALRSGELRHLNLDIRVQGGNATLWGPVPSVELRELALKTIRNLPGILEVRDELYLEVIHPLIIPPLPAPTLSVPLRTVPVPANPVNPVSPVQAPQELKSATKPPLAIPSVQSKEPSKIASLPNTLTSTKSEEITTAVPRLGPLLREPLEATLPVKNLKNSPGHLVQQTPPQGQQSSQRNASSHNSALPQLIERIRCEQNHWSGASITLVGTSIVLRPGNLSSDEPLFDLAQRLRQLAGVEHVLITR